MFIKELAGAGNAELCLFMEENGMEFACAYGADVLLEERRSRRGSEKRILRAGGMPWRVKGLAVQAGGPEFDPWHNSHTRARTHTHKARHGSACL